MRTSDASAVKNGATVSAAQAHGLQAFTEESGLDPVLRAGALPGSPSRRLASSGAGAEQEGLAMRPGVRPRDGVVGRGRDRPREGEGEVMVGAGRGRAQRIRNRTGVSSVTISTHQVLVVLPDASRQETDRIEIQRSETVIIHR